MPAKNFIYAGFAFLFWLFVIWSIGLIWFNYKINHYPEDSITKTDAIVVLTGGRNRIAEGIKLLNMNLADKLFISGVKKNVTVKAIEKQCGVKAQKPAKIELGYQATNTVENAAEISSWVKKNKIKSLRFITSNYHILRGLEELSVYKMPIKIIAHPVYSERVAKKWWQSLGSFKLIVWEYNKFLWTWMAHHLTKNRRNQ